MKKLLLVCLLSGCVGNYETHPPERVVPPTDIHISHGQANGINWNCHQSDANDKVVWIECQFKNTSFIRNSICIQVSYLSSDYRLVATTRNICSEPMDFNQTSENYGAFIKEKREALTKACGIELTPCYMITRNVL